MSFDSWLAVIQEGLCIVFTITMSYSTLQEILFACDYTLLEGDDCQTYNVKNNISKMAIYVSTTIQGFFIYQLINLIDKFVKYDIYCGPFCQRSLS